MNFTIRKADKTDFRAILDLIQKFSKFIKTPEKVTVTLDSMIRDQEYFQCFAAVSGNEEIVGFLSYFIAYYSWTGKTIYIDDLFVIDKYRGNGIGTQLLDYAIKFGKEQSCLKARWQVSKWNTDAIKFYKEKGAIIDEVEINCDLKLEY